MITIFYCTYYYLLYAAICYCFILYRYRSYHHDSHLALDIKYPSNAPSPYLPHRRLLNAGLYNGCTTYYVATI